MRIAAFQAPLLRAGSFEALALIAERVRQCESDGVALLCCPEAILGGLADDAPNPHAFALDVASGQLEQQLASLASDSVTTVVGFTERDGVSLFNAAAIFHCGRVVGVYRKHHPAIRTSIYAAGTTAPVFAIAGLTFGVLLCNDSNYREPADSLVARGATLLLVPSNNGLPASKANVVDASRNADIALATKHAVWVVRADVVGANGVLVSFGSSAIVAPGGHVVACAAEPTSGFLVADVVEQKSA